MEMLRKLIQKINSNAITRNLVLAACALLVLAFLTNVLLNLYTRHGQVHTVPDMRGLHLNEAAEAGKKANLRVEINDSLYMPAYPGGVILEQNPAPGADVKSGRRVFVTINSFKQKMVDIPYVTGFSLRQAKNILEMAGLEIEQLVYQNDLATNNVLGEQFEGKLIRPGSKIQAEIGSGIVLLVGRGEGAPNQTIPRIVGFTAREAKGRLWEAGFNVGKISYDKGVTPLNEKEARVNFQSPTVGARLEHGTAVNFTLTLDENKVNTGLKESDRAARAAAKAEADSLTETETEAVL